MWTYENRGFIAQGDLLFLKGLRFVKAVKDNFATSLFLRMGLDPIHLNPLLDCCILGRDASSAFMDVAVFGLDLFEKMCDLRWQVGDYL